MNFQELEKQMLETLRERRKTLDRAIAQLEKSLSQPPYISSLDFEEIDRIAKKDREFLDGCEREREGKEEDANSKS